MRLERCGTSPAAAVRRCLSVSISSRIVCTVDGINEAQCSLASAEAMVLGMKSGLPPQLIFDLIRAGAGNSRVFELRAPMMVKGRYDNVTMKIDVWQKDMDVIGDFAKKIRVRTPIFVATEAIYRKAMQQGLGAKDTAAVCTVLEKKARLRRKKPRGG